jgi:hypothetical protein
MAVAAGLSLRILQTKNSFMVPGKYLRGKMLSSGFLFVIRQFPRPLEPMNP